MLALIIKPTIMTPEVEAKVLDYYVTEATHDYSLEDHVDQAATSRTAAGTRVRLPSPSELDDWGPGMDEALEELLAEKRAKEAAKKGKFPTVAALVMARMMKRIAVKYADLGLARRSKYLEKEALSALKKGQSALNNPPGGRQEPDTSGGSPWRHLPASAEVREGHEPHFRGHAP
jgi:hypothetical protein